MRGKFTQNQVLTGCEIESVVPLCGQGLEQRSWQKFSLHVTVLFSFIFVLIKFLCSKVVILSYNFIEILSIIASSFDRHPLLVSKNK